MQSKRAGDFTGKRQKLAFVLRGPIHPRSLPRFARQRSPTSGAFAVAASPPAADLAPGRVLDRAALAQRVFSPAIATVRRVVAVGFAAVLLVEGELAIH